MMITICQGCPESKSKEIIWMTIHALLPSQCFTKLPIRDYPCFITYILYQINQMTGCVDYLSFTYSIPVVSWCIMLVIIVLLPNNKYLWTLHKKHRTLVTPLLIHWSHHIVLNHAYYHYYLWLRGVALPALWLHPSFDLSPPVPKITSGDICWLVPDGSMEPLPPG